MFGQNLNLIISLIFVSDMREGKLCICEHITWSRAIVQDFYMDDFVSGADSVTEAEALYKFIYKVLEAGTSMLFRKWYSKIWIYVKSLVIRQQNLIIHYKTTSSLGQIMSSTLNELMYLNEHRGVLRASKTRTTIHSEFRV